MPAKAKAKPKAKRPKTKVTTRTKAKANPKTKAAPKAKAKTKPKAAPKVVWSGTVGDFAKKHAGKPYYLVAKSQRHLVCYLGEKFKGRDKGWISKTKGGMWKAHPKDKRLVRDFDTRRGAALYCLGALDLPGSQKPKVAKKKPRKKPATASTSIAKAAKTAAAKVKKVARRVKVAAKPRAASKAPVKSKPATRAKATAKKNPPVKKPAAKPAKKKVVKRKRALPSIAESAAKPKKRKITKTMMKPVVQEFERLSKIAREKYPEVGSTKLIADPSVHDSPRHFGMASVTQTGPEIRIAPELIDQPMSERSGVLAHELGHIIIMLCLKPKCGHDASERYADEIAEAVFGRKIYYKPNGVQAMGKGARGTRPRPKGLK